MSKPQEAQQLDVASKTRLAEQEQTCIVKQWQGHTDAQRIAGICHGQTEGRQHGSAPALESLMPYTCTSAFSLIYSNTMHSHAFIPFMMSSLTCPASIQPWHHKIWTIYQSTSACQVLKILTVPGPYRWKLTLQII